MKRQSGHSELPMMIIMSLLGVALVLAVLIMWGIVAVVRWVLCLFG